MRNADRRATTPQLLQDALELGARAIYAGFEVGMIDAKGRVWSRRFVRTDGPRKSLRRL
jgi:hypothetical protein